MILRSWPKGHPLRKNREGEEKCSVRANEEKEKNNTADAENLRKEEESLENVENGRGGGDEAVAKVIEGCIGREKIDACKPKESRDERTPHGWSAEEVKAKIMEEAEGDDEEKGKGQGEDGDGERTESAREAEFTEECRTEDVFPEETASFFITPRIIEGMPDELHRIHREEAADGLLRAKAGIERADVADEERIGAFFLEEAGAVEPSCKQKGADNSGTP